MPAWSNVSERLWPASKMPVSKLPSSNRCHERPWSKLASLPVGTAYAVWTGIGTIGTAALGIYLFNEPATLLRLSCIGLILSGIIGLKITS